MRAQGVWKRPVYSDFPYSFRWKNPQTGEEHIFEPEPLLDDVFVTYLKDIPPYSILIYDEMQEAFDRQGWMSVESKVGMSVYAQIRKKRVTVVGATQFFHYLNPRLNDQVDILIRCQDMRFTPWGIAKGIKRGREALLKSYDLSGAITGRSARHPSNSHWVSGEPYDEELVFTEPYWHSFDTLCITNIQHRFISYQIKKEKREILSDTYTGHSRSQSSKELQVAITTIFNEAVARGEKQLKSGEVLQMLKTDGFRIGFEVMGNQIRDMGIQKNPQTRGGVYYIVKELNV